MGELHTVVEGGLVDVCRDVVLLEVGEDVFGGHVAGEVVFCHGASAVSFEGGIESSAAVLVGCVYFFVPVVGLGVEVRPELDVWVSGADMAE